MTGAITGAVVGVGALSAGNDANAGFPAKNHRIPGTYVSILNDVVESNRIASSS